MTSEQKKSITKILNLIRKDMGTCAGDTTNFDLRIPKPLAMYLIGSGLIDDNRNGVVMCKEYGDDRDWVGIVHDDVPLIHDDDEYQTFEVYW